MIRLNIFVAAFNLLSSVIAVEAHLWLLAFLNAFFAVGCTHWALYWWRQRRGRS